MSDRKIDPFDSPESSELGRNPEMDAPESVESEPASETRETVRKALSGGTSQKRGDRIGHRIGERASAKPEKDLSLRHIDLYDLNGMLEEK